MSEEKNMVDITIPIEVIEKLPLLITKDIATGSMTYEGIEYKWRMFEGIGGTTYYITIDGKDYSFNLRDILSAVFRNIHLGEIKSAELKDM